MGIHLVSSEKSFIFLGITIWNDLKGEMNTFCTKKVHQRMVFLQKRNVFPGIMTQVYRFTTESTLIYTLAVWFGSASTCSKTQMLHVAEKWTGQQQIPSTQELCDSQVRNNAGRINMDSTHLGINLFQNLSSGKNFLFLKSSSAVCCWFRYHGTQRRCSDSSPASAAHLHSSSPSYFGQRHHKFVFFPYSAQTS